MGILAITISGTKTTNKNTSKLHTSLPCLGMFLAFLADFIEF